MKTLTSILIALLLTASAAFAGIGGPPYNPKAVEITGGTITGITSLGMASGSSTLGSTACVTGGSVCLINGAGISNSGYSKAATYYLGTTKILFSSTAPTIASGFGTSPSITFANGTAAFRVNVGTGGTSSSGTIAMPAATTGWVCHFDFPTPRVNMATHEVSSTTTSVTVNNNLVSTAAVAAWPSGALIDAICVAY